MTLKIGLIGCGGITEAHVEGWKTVTDQAEISGYEPLHSIDEATTTLQIIWVPISQ